MVDVSQPKKIMLISCGKNKLKTKAKAIDLYVGTTFKMKKNHAIKYADDFFILSAKHGLLKKEDVIEPYECSLLKQSKKYVLDYSNKVIEQIKKNIPEGSIIEFHTPDIYWKYIYENLKNYECLFPVKGLSQGFHRKYYKDSKKSNELKLF